MGCSLRPLRFFLRAALAASVSAILFGGCASSSAAGPTAPAPTAIREERGAAASKEPATGSATASRAEKAGAAPTEWAEASSRGGAADATAATGAASPAAPSVAPRPSAVAPKAEASGLRAGYADDNKQLNYFVQFLEKYGSQAAHFPIDVQERIVLRVRDSAGLPVANADVRVLDGQRTLLRARSYADGTVLFFPRAHGVAEHYRVLVSSLGVAAEGAMDRGGRREIEISLPAARRVPERLPLDIVFILDTTGSMGEEIERLKLTIDLINLNLSSMPTKPIVRFGLVLYRDVGDDYVTRVVQPTADLAAFQAELAGVNADGGGDTPEDLQSALREAVWTVAWNPEGLRLAFVITDAPPHLDYAADVSYAGAVQQAQAMGLKIFTVGTGGLDIDGEYVLRQISQYTYARYIFLTYGERGESEGGVAGSVSHHSGANFQTDKLESIIIRFAREELAHQSAKPLEEGEEYFEAVTSADEEREATLGKLFDMAIGQLADYASARIPSSTRVAAVPLVSKDASLAAQAEYLSEQLILSLTRSSLFRVVERKDLQKILEELELQLSGLVDDAQAAKVGNILGAEVLVSGTLYAKEDRYELFLKLLRVETGEILSVTKARVDRKLGI